MIFEILERRVPFKYSQVIPSAVQWQVSLLRKHFVQNLETSSRNQRI